jgi:hypothetical protein
MPVDECTGDNAHQESHNESIGSDHLFEQVVIRPRGLDLYTLADN